MNFISDQKGGSVSILQNALTRERIILMALTKEMGNLTGGGNICGGDLYCIDTIPTQLTVKRILTRIPNDSADFTVKI